MKTIKKEAHVPEVGEVLKFILCCFDIPKKGNAISYKQVERLAKGKDITQEAMEKVSRSVLDAIYRELSLGAAPEGITTKTLEDLESDPTKISRLETNAEGIAVIPEHQFLKDLIGFCWRHQFVLREIRNCKEGKPALSYWLTSFVIPFVAFKMVDYYFTTNNPDVGMPSGTLWLVPGIKKTENPSKPYRLDMPSQIVLLWWEDLLGHSLEKLSAQLCPNSGEANAQRQVAAWKYEAVPPELETIRRWTSQNWKYEGVFKDDVNSPINERWERCRVFLEVKGMERKSNWLQGVEKSPFDLDQMLLEKYRGERLEEEIAPFKDCPFQRFFDSADPVAEGLPVERLIEKVAARWRPPTTQELHSRLMIGRAMTKAWNSCSLTIGGKNALLLSQRSTRTYNYYMTLFEKVERITEPELLLEHFKSMEQADPAFLPTAAMISPDFWLQLPEYLRRWIKGEIVFNE